MTIHALAIDWSGDRKRARRKIWLAEAVGDKLRRLEKGRDCSQIAHHLIEEMKRDPSLVVGLDFAFSFPESFCQERGLRGIADVWDLVEREGETWLRTCPMPFWGRAGTKGPKDKSGFRATELTVAKEVQGAQPKSVFQIGGAGAVGTGSIRGMPVLRQLRQAGFSIWPFDPLRVPCVIEIYPRALTGPLNKTSREQRMAYLRGHYPALPDGLRERAGSSEDALDAAVFGYGNGQAS